MRQLVGLAVVVLLVGLAGCGGVDDPAATQTPDPDIVTPTDDADPPATQPETATQPKTAGTGSPTGTAGASPTATAAGTDTPAETDTATATATPGETPTPTPGGSDGDGDGSGDGRMLVHFINDGQADATLIETSHGETMLIDSGDWRDDGQTVIDYLETQDVDRIDYLVATHAHADHIGGHAAIIEHYETERDGIGQAWDSGVPHSSNTYEEYLEAVDEHDVDLIEAREGDEIPMAGATVELFNPPEDRDSDDQDDNSVTLHVEYGDASFLFTGDAGADAEQRMMDEHGVALNADVFHAGHHGSSDSSSAAMIEAVEPQFTVISSAYDSQYGHPHNETLERFADREVDAFWTGTHGTIVAGTDGETIAVGTHHDAPIDPLELRSAEEATAEPDDPVEERERYEAQNTKGAEFGYPSATAAAAVALLVVGRRRW